MELSDFLKTKPLEAPMVPSLRKRLSISPRSRWQDQKLADVVQIYFLFSFKIPVLILKELVPTAHVPKVSLKTWNRLWVCFFLPEILRNAIHFQIKRKCLGMR